MEKSTVTSYISKWEYCVLLPHQRMNKQIETIPETLRNVSWYYQQGGKKSSFDFSIYCHVLPEELSLPEKFSVHMNSVCEPL